MLAEVRRRWLSSCGNQLGLDQGMVGLGLFDILVKQDNVARVPGTIVFRRKNGQIFWIN